MTSRFLIPAVAAAALSLLTACGGGDAEQDSVASRSTPSSVAITPMATPQTGGIGGSGSPVPQVGGIGGSGILLVGRASTCGTTSVAVTLVGARVNSNGAAAAGAGGWLDVAMSTPLQVDLTTLAAGTTLPLDFTGVPDGTYRQLRLMQVAGDGDGDGQGQDAGSGGSQGAQGGPQLAASITVVQGRGTGAVDLANLCKSASARAGTAAVGAGATTG